MKVIKVSPEEYRKIKLGPFKIKTDKFVLLISIIASLILLYSGLYFKLYIDYITLAALILAVFSVMIFPYLFYKAMEGSIDKKIEENYPTFLRDLSEALSSGMTLTQALKHISKIDYGPLSMFINKLYTWLSWGVDFVKAFEKFNKYFEGNPTIMRANYIILEAYKEGGNIEKVLKTVADDLESIKELEKTKKSYVSQQVIVLYVIFFIFIGLIIMLKYVLEPMITQQVMLQSQQQVFSFSSQPIDYKHFKLISTLAILIEGIFIAFVIGVAETGRIKGGFKHLIVTLLVSVIAILVFVLPEQVSFSVIIFPKQAYAYQQVSIDGTLTVDAKPIDNEVVTLIISGPESVYKKLPVKNGRFKYTFTPTKPGEYRVKVIYNRGLKKYEVTDSIKVQ